VARIRAAIVDDEVPARAALHLLLAADPEIEVVGEAADGRGAIALIEREHPDLVFLDVQMPELTGFEVLRALDPEALPAVVFVTAYDQYALHAFDVHAADYLLKPFSDARFQETLRVAKTAIAAKRLGDLRRRLAELLSAFDAGAARGQAPVPTLETEATGARSRYLERLVLREGDKVVIQKVAEIDWIDADGDYVRVHVGKTSFRVRETVKRLVRQLDPARFARIHRSMIVNVDRIRELQPYYRGEYAVLLLDGTRLKLSRGRRAALETLLGDRI
jgi:two-component system, LytTR family, response regulator